MSSISRTALPPQNIPLNDPPTVASPDPEAQRQAENARANQKVFVKAESEKRTDGKIGASVDAVTKLESPLPASSLQKEARGQEIPQLAPTPENEAKQIFELLAERLPEGISAEIGLPFAAEEILDRALALPMPAQPEALEIGRAAALPIVDPKDVRKEILATLRGYDTLTNRLMRLDSPGILDAHAALLAKLAPGQREALQVATGEVRMAYSAFQKSDTPIIPSPLMSRLEHAASLMNMPGVDIDQLMFMVMIDGTRTEESLLRDKLNDMQSVNKQKKQLREIKTRMHQEQARLESQMHEEFNTLKGNGSLHASITFENYRDWRQCQWADVEEGVEEDGGHTASWPAQAAQLQQPSPPQVPEWMRTGTVGTQKDSGKGDAGSAICTQAGLPAALTKTLKSIYEKLSKEAKAAAGSFEDWVSGIGLATPAASKEDIIDNLKLVKDFIGQARSDAQKVQGAAITQESKGEIVQLYEQLFAAKLIEKTRELRVQAGNYDMPAPAAPMPDSATLSAQIAERLKGAHASDVNQATIAGWISEARANVAGNMRRATDTMRAIAKMQGREIDEGFNKDLENAMRTAYPPIEEGSSGVLGGAAAGATAGSVFPGIGTIIGGLGGAVLGFFFGGSDRECTRVNIGFGAAGVQGNIEVSEDGKHDFGIANFPPLVPLMQALGSAGTSLTQAEMEKLTIFMDSTTEAAPALGTELLPAGANADATFDGYLNSVDGYIGEVQQEKGAYWSYVHRKHFDGSASEKPKPAEGAAKQSAGGAVLGNTGSLEEMKAYTEAVDNKLQTLSDLSETETIKLQAMQDRRSKLLEALSNLLKKTSQTNDTIAQNMK